jgi:uncharacterized protein
VVTAVPALYHARISHHRRTPVDHRFDYGGVWWLVDADAPPRFPRPWRWLARFDTADRMDVRGLVAAQGIATDRLLMLGQARTLGYHFDPLTVYWSFDLTGELNAVVAEVHNTYGERQAYVLPAGPEGSDAVVDKALYVSPYHPEQGRYRMRVSTPGAEVKVEVSLVGHGGQPFTASLHGRRAPASRANFLRLSLRYPWPPLRVAALIRWQAIRLRLRGVPVFQR